jgi:hypothetical protein
MKEFKDGYTLIGFNVIDCVDEEIKWNYIKNIT